MPADESRAAYLHLSRALYERRFPETELPAQSAFLPPLTAPLLEQLQRQASETALASPRRAWALAAVTDARAAHGDDLRLQALAAFNLARAANAWVQPERVWEAALRARTLFAALDESGWVAACDWQRYATPWACNDFQEAARTLQQALSDLDAPAVAHWQVECRLSLAFAHILLTEFDTALLHLERCEQHFRSRDDGGGLAQTLTSRAACLRRVSRFEPAIAAAEEALHLLVPLQQPLDLARARFQLGYILLLQGVAYTHAEKLLQKALTAFDGAGVALWAAQCHNALARLFRETGRVARAAEALQEARRTFRRFPILGLRADVLLDSAVFALRNGQPRRSLVFLAEAEPIYQQLNVWYLAAACNLYRGETYAELGRYQLALHYLELAYGQMRELKRRESMAEAALRLGEAWLWLDRPGEALGYLQEATTYYEEMGHTSFLAELYSLLTAARLRHGDDVAEIITSATAALRRLQPHGVQPYLALLQRFIGEAHLASAQSDQALSHLQSAAQKFETMSMSVEVAECCLPLGHCYRALGHTEAANSAWQRALDLTQGSLPEIAWRAYDGLAQLAAAAGQTEQALDHYAAMIAAFGRLRRWFWQPSLAGAYLNRSGQALDRAVALAGARNSPLALSFVEESKAQTVNRRLRGPAEGGRMSGEATAGAQRRELADEIRWLQQEIATARQSSAPAASWMRLQSELVDRVKRYEKFASRSERQVQSAGQPAAGDSFDLQAFRRAATETLGDRWLALDFYLTGEALVCVALTPHDQIVRYDAFSPRLQRALRVFTRATPTSAAAPGQATAPPEGLAALARWLLPADLLGNLSPDTTLIISPHRQLHHLPWAALPWPAPSTARARPLATRCVPLLTPSLNVFTLLQRRERRRVTRREGCVVAVSQFGSRHPPLPQVQHEVAALAAQMGAHGRLLSGEQATWNALRALGHDSGLTAYAFLHVASHAFLDSVTGRASGLAFAQRDVWLDELWELAPLPALVSLSACSGMQSYLYAGDEPIGLAATCLQAGAQQVVGSLWRIRDDDAATITGAFYEHFFDGAHPALALARAQRQAIAAGAAWGCWAPFVCVGAL